MPGHIALAGDSIFDNASYTRGEPDVVAHLNAIVGRGWRGTLVAVDGATTSDIHRQASRIPRDATHVVLAVGGNDALQNGDLLSRPSSSTAHTLTLFAERIERFERAYRHAVDAIAAIDKPTTICTIYNGWLDAAEARVARVALTTFNDVILRVAFERALQVIDLRLVCDEAEDYANAIEPSGTGGRKIALAVARATGAIDQGGPVSRVFVRGE